MSNLVRLTLSNVTNRVISSRHITDNVSDFPPDPPSTSTYTIDLALENYYSHPTDVNYSYWLVKPDNSITEMSEVEKDTCDAEMKKIRDDNEKERRKAERDKIGGTKSDIEIDNDVNSIPFNRLKPEESPPHCIK